MKVTRNYFGESNFNHYVNKVLKKHPHNAEPSIIGSQDNQSIKNILEENQEIISRFTQEFPRNSHVQKLSLYLTPKSVTEELKKNTSHKFEKLLLNFQEIKSDFDDKYTHLYNTIVQIKTDMNKNNENNSLIFATRKSLEDFIEEIDEKEKRLNSLVEGYKNDYSEKMKKIENQVNSLENLRGEFIKHSIDTNKTLTNLQAEIRLTDRRALYATTFNNYKRVHESEFLTKVQIEKNKMKDELMRLIENKLSNKVQLEEKVDVKKT